MTDNQNLEKRVGHLEIKVTEIVTALGGLKSIMDEVKTSLANSKPSWWVLFPSFLTFVGLLVGGVVAVASIRSDISSLYAIKNARDEQITRMDARLDTMEKRQWDQLQAERDYWRGRVNGQQSSPGI